MNFIYKAVFCFAMGFVALAGSYQESKACDRTIHVLDSIVFDGTNYTIYTTACIGGGVLGGSAGGDNGTSILALAIYSASATYNTVGFGPPTITSDTLGCTQTGFVAGSPLLGSNTTIGYVDNFGACPNGFICTNSTAICGQPHEDCSQFFFVVNEIPDSIRLLGAEATGNPIAGCYPNPELVIDFTILPVVWRSFDARVEDEAAELQWSTSSESNSDHYQVMRSSNGRDWEPIGTVMAAGDASSESRYSFTDWQPLRGINQYRLKQVDKNGQYSRSAVVQVAFEMDATFGWAGIGPVPTQDFLNVSFTAPEDQQLSMMVFNQAGQVAINKTIDARYGKNSLQLDLSSMASGVYFIRLKGASGALNHKVIKN